MSDRRLAQQWVDHTSVFRVQRHVRGNASQRACPNRPLRVFATIAIVLLAGALLSCGKSAAAAASAPSGPDPFVGRNPVDLGGYVSMASYKKPTQLANTTVAEIVQLMDAHKTFAFVAAFDDCSYCNRLMPYLSDAALDAGRRVGYLNTRKDPSWTSNTDITDYDLFVERFSSYLQEDEEGVPHLYTPALFFVRNGEVVANHEGITPGVDDPNQPLSNEQEQALRETLAQEFALLN